MRVVIQRVSHASVSIDGVCKSAIKEGFMILVGIESNFRLDRKQEAMDAVRDYFMSREQATASMDFDGYRVEFPQWWFNIRPSNTEPYLRFLCEATTRELLEEKVAKVREIIAKWE